MAHVPVFARSAKAVLIALLLGIELEVSEGTMQNIGLVLRRVESPDHTRQLYVPYSFWPCEDGYMHPVELERDPQRIVERMKTTLEWRTIYIVRGNPLAMDQPTLQVVSANLRAPFHIPRSEIKKLLESTGNVSCSLHPPNPTDLSWRRYVALKADVSLPFGSMRVVIYLGLCGKASLDHCQHWARIVVYHYSHTRGAEVEEPEGQIEHHCTEHHVDERPRQTHLLWMYDRSLRRYFGRALELSFEPYPLSLMHCRRVSIRTEDTPEFDGEGGPESMALTVARGH